MMYANPELLNPDRLPLAMTAIVLSAVAGLVSGPLQGYAGPLLWRLADNTLGRIGRRLDRSRRSTGELFYRGLVYAVLALFFGLGLGSVARNIVWTFPQYDLAEIVLLCLCLSSGAVWRSVWRVYRVLADKQKRPGAYYAIAVSSGLDLSGADDFTITRVAVGYAVRMFSLAVVGPVFWYLVYGLPAAYAYSIVAALAWHLGRDGHGKGFGRAILQAEALTGFLPQICAALIVSAAAFFTPAVSVLRAVRGWFADAPYFEGGRLLSSAAWGLDVSLGGPVTSAGGETRKCAWTGPEGASARLEPSHIKRVLYLLIVANIIVLAVLAAIMTIPG